MKTVSELILLSAEFLKKKEIENPRRVAEDLVADALKLKRLELYLSFDRPLEDSEVEKIRNHLSRRVKGEPWQYISGEIDFYKCKIKVNPWVLIPRQETEILVDIIAKELSSQNLQGKVLLDLCSGSGCIGLALKKRFPDLQVALADLSSEALQLASENAISNKLVVELLHGDFLHALDGRSFDFIVCNPPYVSEKSYLGLHSSVKDYEPMLALVAKDDGLEFYARFAAEGRHHLRARGKAWFEIGYDQGEHLKRLFNNAPWKNGKLEKDWSAHDRFFSLEIE